MAFESLQAQLAMLINQINTQPEDVHELYERIAQMLGELKATGQPLPADLVEFEKRMEAEFPKAAPKKA
ncbi:hypothetical protein [Aestuariivirga sp.]|uniref:hypothetical protein n=1 Tax=Aestuariivirga sp. TaxID=2650926 RepID=UPI0039E6697C